jgi:hypothetical protein
MGAAFFVRRKPRFPWLEEGLEGMKTRLVVLALAVLVSGAAVCLADTIPNAPSYAPCQCSVSELSHIMVSGATAALFAAVLCVERWHGCNQRSRGTRPPWIRYHPSEALHQWYGPVIGLPAATPNPTPFAE